MTRKAFAFILLLLSAPALGLAGAASVSWNSLLLPRGARPSSLGGAYTALAAGAEALIWNPAGMNQVRALQLTGGHLNYLDGISDDYVLAALPIYGLGSWGLGFTHLGAEGQSYDVNGNPTNIYHADETVVMVSLGIELPMDAHLGFGYKLLRQNYVTESSMGSGFDLGVQWRDFFNKRLDLGATLLNLGTPVALGNTYFNLPVTAKAGFALHLLPGWTLTADDEFQFIDQFNKVRLGTELSQAVGPLILSTRLGFSAGAEHAQGDWGGLGAGLGLAWGAWDLDYAFNPQGDLGQSHRISLTYTSWR